MTNIAVVILNYNGAALLERFLPTVIQYSSEADIVVADNGSTDHSCETIRTSFPGVRLIALEKNYGFCGGYNRALSQVEARYYVLLNSDVEVTPGWLSPLSRLLDSHPEIAAVQPKILSVDRPTHFEYAGAGGGMIDAFGYPFCRGRLFDYVERDEGQYNDERPVFWTSGACMMIRSEAFHAFNGFDERFFAHMEEIDLCWKLNRSGRQLYYTGKSHVFHIGAGTLAYHHPRKTYLNFRNGLMMLIKHLGSGEMIFKLPVRVLLDWVASLAFVLKGEGANALSVLRAHASVANDIRRLLHQRKTLLAKYPRYSRANIYRGLVVFDYYLRRNRRINV
jgi:GT2 family glycosyltransferase